ncbi:MAG: hypothetical protein IKI13_00360 [Bacteroidales bacterium]|nr:hypothetical protein [Bacteroidales bacterium]
MKRLVTALASMMSVVGLAVLSEGCSLIDEQLVNCPEEVIVDYHVRLITNKEQELDTKLGTYKNRPLREAIEDYLSDIFVETAHDADLSFYALPADEREFHAGEIWNAGEKSYSLQLPAGDYNNLVAANLADNGVVRLTGDETSAGSYFDQNAEDVVASHKTGVFSARKLMPVIHDHKVQQHFDVDLYMANDAGGILLNVDSCYFSNIRCEIEGLADGFNLQDSTYTYSSHTRVKADLIDAQPYVDRASVLPQPTVTPVMYRWQLWKRTPVIFCGVGFSSRTSDLLTTYDDQPVYWAVHLYVTLSNGSVTKSTVYAGEPLPAANLKLIMGWLLSDGSFAPEPPLPPSGPPEPEPDPELDLVVGVDVQLDWKPGLDFDPII